MRNVLVPLQALYRRHRREVPVDPTSGLDLPEPARPRERAATPAEATELLAALPDDLRPLYATAFYAGLRRGELRALRWSHVSGVLSDRPLKLHVSASWDDKAGQIEPKSIKSTRKVACPELLRPYLETQLARTGRGGDDLVFGRTASDPFTPSHVRRMAAKAWAAENTKRARRSLPLVEPIGLHECRHTYVSLMAAAGVPLERIGDYVGHASSYMTNRYRHLIEGQGVSDAQRLDAYVRAATGAHAGAHEAADA